MAHDQLIQTLQNFLGVEHIVLAGRGALGIWAALRVWGGNGPVALSAAVCQDVIAAVLMAGRSPFFCDVDPGTGLTPASEWLRARDAGAEAAILVHLYGNPAEVGPARAAFPDGLVIDDAAQALGALTPDGLAGVGGDVGIVSFGHTKHIEVGGAALLCRDAALAGLCAKELNFVECAPRKVIQATEFAFRTRFEQARERLWYFGDPCGFSGLLADYGNALRLAWNPDWPCRITNAIADYPSRLATRRAKAARWADAIAGTGLLPVGMGPSAAPWRYACRLPGCGWILQQRLGDALRSHGLDVSHWYLPGHWLVNAAGEHLPGVEQLAQEAFQFWLDESIDMEGIDRAATILKLVLKSEERYL